MKIVRIELCNSVDQLIAMFGPKFTGRGVTNMVGPSSLLGEKKIVTSVPALTL